MVKKKNLTGNLLLNSNILIIFREFTLPIFRYIEFVVNIIDCSVTELGNIHKMYLKTFLTHNITILIKFSTDFNIFEYYVMFTNHMSSKFRIVLGFVRTQVTWKLGFLLALKLYVRLEGALVFVCTAADFTMVSIFRDILFKRNKALYYH